MSPWGVNPAVDNLIMLVLIDFAINQTFHSDAPVSLVFNDLDTKAVTYSS